MQRCPNCQNPLPPKANFCRQCGHALVETAAKVASAPGNNSSTVTADSPLTGSGKQPPVAAPVSASQKMPPVTAPKAPEPSSASMDDEYEGGGATLFGVEGSLGAAPVGPTPNATNASEADLIGQNLGSSGYKIEKKLGEGGMGAVYKATHPNAKPLAIKVLHAEFANDAKTLERFFNEAKAVNKINQPHIVDISDFGFLTSGQPYIAMEFLEGFDLAGRLQQQSPLMEGEALDITIQVLEALYAAHQVNIIHRDMKPENIFLLKNKKQPDKWFVKVLDFGIAKLSQQNSQQTQSGTILGTPRYMSPEQARGEREIGPGADLYSLGIIVYELVTGRAPFDEPSYLGYLVAHQRKVPPQPKEFVPTLSDDTNRIIMKCLEKTPEKRFATAKEMRDELIACLQRLGNVQTRLATPMGQFPVAKDLPKNQTFVLTDQAAPEEPKKPEPRVQESTAIVASQNKVQAPAPQPAANPVPANNSDTAPAEGGSMKTIGIAIGAVVLIALILFLVMGGK